MNTVDSATTKEARMGVLEATAAPAAGVGGGVGVGLELNLS